MKCFVISPIGQPGSAAREHADDVFECIIAPALKEATVDGHRADHVKDVGRITRQMYDAILFSDFCIAVLHGFNPNVFYELAIAHSAGIPVILMSEKGLDPPFDLKDERVFHYDLSPRSIHRGDNVRALLSMIDSVRRLQGKREVPFGSNLSPLNASGARLPYSLSSETNASADYWLGLVTRARHRLFLAGIGFMGWRGIPGMKDALLAKVDSGCEVRVLTLDQNNPALACMLNPEIETSSALNQTPRLADTRSWFGQALTGNPRAEVRSLRSGMLFQQIIISDAEMIVSPYLFTANTAYSPRLEISESSAVFGLYMREFEGLWNLNAPKHQTEPRNS